MKAFSLIRDMPWYRRQAFELGLKRAGYEVIRREPLNGCEGDVLLIWNRYAMNHLMASNFERRGGRVIVAENGYIGRGGSTPKFSVHPKGPGPDDYYALALGYHNGAGTWPSGGPERFRALCLELAPWRAGGEHVLICPNRSFGVGAQVMHPDWGQRCAERLSKTTRRPVRIRAHPGNDAPKRPLAEDLRGAWAVMVWGSSVAVHSLAAGIPTFIEAPNQILKGAGASGSIDDPKLPERLPHFERMAWAQYTCAELESGEPFKRLLA